jgi:hypothetical protein
MKLVHKIHLGTFNRVVLFIFIITNINCTWKLPDNFVPSDPENGNVGVLCNVISSSSWITTTRDTMLAERFENILKSVIVEDLVSKGYNPIIIDTNDFKKDKGLLQKEQVDSLINYTIKKSKVLKVSALIIFDFRVCRETRYESTNPGIITVYKGIPLFNGAMHIIDKSGKHLRLNIISIPIMKYAKTEEEEQSILSAIISGIYNKTKIITSDEVIINGLKECLLSKIPQYK